MAEVDLKAAAYLMKLGADCPAEVICFHAQQCVEKYLKACLVWRQIDFPKTHDIAALIGMIPPGVRAELPPDDQRRLTAYATAARYPGGHPTILPGEARRALRLARRVRAQTRKALPRPALTTPKRLGRGKEA